MNDCEAVREGIGIGEAG
ncbi:unnamed protein product, partial [Rotaria socialis]